MPPYPGSIRKLFEPKTSPLLKRGGKMEPFIAYRDGQPVGRIAAILNPGHNDYYQNREGFFGYFDFIEDIEVARALRDRAVARLREWQRDIAIGPMNPTSNDEFGVLTDGFEAAPMVMMPYNPSYYPAIYEALGAAKAREVLAFYIPSATPVADKIQRVVRRVRERTGVTFRTINLKRLDEELKIIEMLYNATLFHNWGFVPITLPELQAAAADLKAIMNPEMVLIAEKGGEPIGFSMVIPNINEHMAAARKYKGIFRILKFVWLLKTKHPREGRLAILGVKPEYEAVGIPAVFYEEAIMRGRKFIIGGELSWIDEGNVKMIRSLEMMGAKRTKAYRVYQWPV